MAAGIQVLHGYRILVVEDDFLLATDICDVLTEAGAIVTGPASSVAEGLRLIAEDTNGLDGAVLDVDLRGERSYALADALIVLGVRFVFTTGYSADGLAETYRGHPRCEKPISRASLLAALTVLDPVAHPDP